LFTGAGPLSRLAHPAARLLDASLKVVGGSLALLAGGRPLLGARRVLSRGVGRALSAPPLTLPLPATRRPPAPQKRVPDEREDQQEGQQVVEAH